MLEIAGGIVIAVVVLVLLYVVMMDYGNPIRDFLTEIALYVAVVVGGWLALFGLGWISITIWHMLVPRYWTSARARAVCDPIFGLLCLGLLVLFYTDSLDGFFMTKSVFRFIGRGFKRLSVPGMKRT